MRDRLAQETKAALKAQDKPRLGALRLISAALQEREIATRTDKLSEPEVAAVLQKMLKQRRDSLAIYEKAGRQDLANQEAKEIEVIEEFLPQQLGEGEVRAAIVAIIKDVGAAGPRDMGKVMAALKARYAGQMDFGKVSALVKELLAAAAP
ncbi:MAG TPA: GatB/YqeY domain-containing protein [Hyphomicrobiaceae bacterium]|nr:GatB/YqeY domain-containing protein [Hyphomicrobiaceae bacterium]